MVYRFLQGERVDIDNPQRIVAVTDDTFYRLPLGDGSQRYVYVVTALNRIHNESKPVKVKVRI